MFTPSTLTQIASMGHLSLPQGFATRLCCAGLGSGPLPNKTDPAMPKLTRYML